MSHATTALILFICSFFQRGFVFLAFFEFFFKVRIDLLYHFLVVLFFKNSFLDKLISILGRQGFHTSDLAIHYRLCESRLIHFVVTVFTESNHVHEDILPKLLPVSNQKLRNSDHRFRVMSIHTDNRSLERLHYIGGVRETTAIFRVCRKTNLVICDNVDAPSN